MKRTIKLVLATLALFLPVACASDSVEMSTPNSTQDSASQTALDQTSVNQIQTMLDTLTSLQDDPTGFQVNYYEPNSNTLAFYNFYVRGSDLPQSDTNENEILEPTINPKAMTTAQHDLVEAEMIDFNHDLLTILKDATYQPLTDSSSTGNRVIHIFNVMDQPNNVSFDVYTDGSIIVTFDDQVTRASINSTSVEMITDLFEPLIKTYSGKQFHWVDDLSI